MQVNQQAYDAQSPFRIMARSRCPERPNLELLVLDAPWGIALEDPETLMDLVQRGVDCGSLSGLMAAARRCGDGSASSAQLAASAESRKGMAPRLVGDSTVSNANRLCRISEKIELPTPGAVEEFISRHSDEQWVAFVLDDVKTAHKRVKVAVEDQGYSVFTAVDPQGVTRWLVYLTCHFGARGVPTGGPE